MDIDVSILKCSILALDYLFLWLKRSNVGGLSATCSWPVKALVVSIPCRWATTTTHSLWVQLLLHQRWQWQAPGQTFCNEQLETIFKPKHWEVFKFNTSLTFNTQHLRHVTCLRRFKIFQGLQIWDIFAWIIRFISDLQLSHVVIGSMDQVVVGTLDDFGAFSSFGRMRVKNKSWQNWTHPVSSP